MMILVIGIKNDDSDGDDADDDVEDDDEII